MPSSSSASCRDADIRCDEVPPGRYFKDGMCDGAFLTQEYTYDAQILKDYFLERIAGMSNVEIIYGARLSDIHRDGDHYEVSLTDGRKFEAPFVLNATYASVNQVNNLAGFDPFRIKYELCEIILTEPSPALSGIGLTVMDGPFFSIMPFGKTGMHSLTSVTFTPHTACKESLPIFDCQRLSGGHCSPSRLGNCNDCPSRPASAWPYMSNLAHKYMRDHLAFSYRGSLFSMKSIWYGRQERVFGSKAEREALIDYTRQACRFARAIGCRNLVFGNPRNRDTSDLVSDIPVAIDFFRAIGEIALENETVIAIEPNPVIYNTHFINTTAEALEMVQRVNSPGIKINFDLGTVICNDEDWSQLRQIGPYVNHVHISEPYLKPIEERRELHESILSHCSACLPSVFVSIEMGNPGAPDQAKKAVDYIADLAERLNVR